MLRDLEERFEVYCGLGDRAEGPLQRRLVGNPKRVRRRS